MSATLDRATTQHVARPTFRPEFDATSLTGCSAGFGGPSWTYWAGTEELSVPACYVLVSAATLDLVEQVSAGRWEQGLSWDIGIVVRDEDPVVLPALSEFTITLEIESVESGCLRAEHDE